MTKQSGNHLRDCIWVHYGTLIHVIYYVVLQMQCDGAMLCALKYLLTFYDIRWSDIRGLLKRKSC